MAIAMIPVAKTECYLKYGLMPMEYEAYYCPKCGTVLNAGPNYQPKYCGECGQGIDFSGVTWESEKEFTGKEL